MRAGMLVHGACVQSGVYAWELYQSSLYAQLCLCSVRPISYQLSEFVFFLTVGLSSSEEYTHQLVFQMNCLFNG